MQSVEIICECQQPANPDKPLLGCTNKSCEKWLHNECLEHRALLSTYERLGKDKPHVKPPESPKDSKDEEEPKRPLSPKETGGAVSAQHSIDVKADGIGDGEAVQVNDNVEVKRIEDDAPTASEDRTVSSETPAKDGSATETTSKLTPGRRSGRPRKRNSEAVEDNSKPYLGLFTATVRSEISPPMVEIRDIRHNIEGGEKTWLEPIDCPICGARIL